MYNPLIRRGLISMMLAIAMFVSLVGAVVVGTGTPAAAQSGASLGVYRGAGSSAMDEIPVFEAWLGRPVDLIEDFIPGDSWDLIAGNGSWDPLWYWKSSGLLDNRDLIVSVPMLTSGSTLTQCANGNFDSHFRAHGENLVGYGEANAVIRLGWEFNGTWYPWSITDIDAFSGCWRSAVDAMRSAPGQKFSFDWNPTLGIQWPGGNRFGAAQVDQAWPGDGYVDIVGLDVYDQVPQATTDPVARWAQLRDGELNLEWWANFAAAHNKPLSFPEWAVSSGRSDGGGDNGYYIDKMHEFIETHNVVYHSYFEFDAPDGSHELQGTAHPESANSYLANFSSTTPRPLDPSFPGTSPSTPGAAPPSPAGTDQSPGYLVLRGSGAVERFPGGAQTASAASGTSVAIAARPNGTGWWSVDTAGVVTAQGSAPWLGDTAGLVLSQPIVGMAASPSGNGYWLVAADGGVFTFGDATFLGSTGAVTLNQPIVGMAASPSGNGYWLVAADGGVFTFGDATFFGSTGGIPLVQPIVGMNRTASGSGYWLVAADGGVFTFGDATFFGSTGAIASAHPVTGMASAPGGNGYWLITADGSVTALGGARDYGSSSGEGASTQATAIAAV